MTNFSEATTTPISDAEIMARMMVGDSTAMNELYDRYARPVFSFALRMMGDRELAEELLQEVFLRAWRQAARYSDSRGSLISWLLSITHNMAIDELRKIQRRPQRAGSADPTATLNAIRDEAEPVDELATRSATASVVRAELDRLPPAQREVLELGYFRGLTQREIAEVLNQPLGTIKTRMRLAIRKLQDSEDIQALDVK